VFAHIILTIVSGRLMPYYLETIFITFAMLLIFIELFYLITSNVQCFLVFTNLHLSSTI